MIQQETHPTRIISESKLYEAVLNGLSVLVDKREKDFFLISDFIDSQVHNLSINDKILLICESMSTQVLQSGTYNYESHISHMSATTIIKGLSHIFTTLNEHVTEDFTLTDAIQNLNVHGVLQIHIQNEP